MNREERRRAAKTSEQDPAAPLAKGFAYHQRGRLAAAEAQYRQALRMAPSHPDAIRLLAELLVDLGQFDEAITLSHRLIAATPQHFAAHYTLANALRLAGRAEPAVEAYRAALALNPAFAGAWHGLGTALRLLQREPEALEAFRQAARFQPDWAVAWKDLGLTFAILGDLKLAEAALERAVSLQPGLGDAQRHLAALRAGPASAEDIASLAAAAAHPATPPAERIELLYAGGRLADQAGDYQAAWQHFAAANALQRAAAPNFNRAALTSRIDNLIAAFPHPQPQNTDNAEAAPVFIVGMPRAGSTLFEQIAASHSQVFGAGEQTGIGAIAAQLGATPNPAWTQPALAAAASAYLSPLRAQAGLALRIIDKMPDNIFHLGLIAALFPRARIIFCARDAWDIALSCFFQNFAQPLGYDTALADCFFRIQQIDRLTTHWRETLPLAHLTMSYEALLAAPEAESRRLIAFLGLDWEPACLDFNKTNRAVRTASWAQVRQPLYQHAAGRWRHYEAFMLKEESSFL
jgi:tetratricopeptide (TPR) repeat protein